MILTSQKDGKFTSKAINITLLEFELLCDGILLKDLLGEDLDPEKVEFLLEPGAIIRTEFSDSVLINDDDYQT